MKLSRYAASASLAVLLAASAGSVFAATPLKLSGHVANWVTKSAMVGAANESETVRLKAFLGFRNADDLKALIARQSTPGSADYNHYLTAAQFHQRFAPSAADAAKVEDGLRALGFTVTGRPQSNLFVDFTGTVGQIKTAFAVSQNLYSYQGKVMRANVEEPTIPASMNGLVNAIVGLDDTGQLTHPFHHSAKDLIATKTQKTAAISASASPMVGPPVADNSPLPYCSTYFGDNTAILSTKPTPYATKLPWLVCGYTPKNMREAYGSNLTEMDGTGVRVAIVDAFISPTLLPDANRYSQHYKLPTLKEGTNFTTLYGGDIKAVSASNACNPQGWFGEISLDVDAVHSMAPGASIVYSGALSCADVDLNAAIYTVVDGTATVGGPLADIITNSYGDYGEPESAAELNVDNAIFEQANAEGVTLLFSSGDNGDSAAIIGVASASYPASNPLVTAVGGTSLALRDARGVKLEWGWGSFYSYLNGSTINSDHSITDSGVGSFQFYAGSGGGPSFDFLQPSYQAPVVPKRLTVGAYSYPDGAYQSFKGQHRVTPDISMDADPFTGFMFGETFTIAGDPTADAGCTQTTSVYEYCESSIGGTSLASPLFAGTLALVLQARAANGLTQDLGMLNPRLYGLTVGAHGSTTTPLIDISPPSDPMAVLLSFAGDSTDVLVVTMNSTPGPSGPLCTTSFCNGQDSFILQTRQKYDDVTGLGTPYIPALISTLGANP